MKLGTFSGHCDICGCPRGGKIKHDACAKKRKAQGLKNQPSETERLALGRVVQRGYVRNTFKPPE